MSTHQNRTRTPKTHASKPQSQHAATEIRVPLPMQNPRLQDPDFIASMPRIPSTRSPEFSHIPKSLNGGTGQGMVSACPRPLTVSAPPPTVGVSRCTNVHLATPPDLTAPSFPCPTLRPQKRRF